MLAAVFPAIVNAKDSPHTYRNRLSFLSGALLLYGLAASVLMTVFAPLIVNIIYGSAFDGSVSMLQIYSWSITGMVLSFLVSQFLLTENLRRIQLVCGIAPMVINIILNLILIPRLGATGAALATVISYSLVPLIPLTYGSVRRLLWRPASVS
jgi:O-antigen/teichoic acid export membrane protein